MEGPSADSREKREPVGDIDTAVVDSLKVLDPKPPIREADIASIKRRLCLHTAARNYFGIVTYWPATFTYLYWASQLRQLMAPTSGSKIVRWPDSC
jgi:hypothetical protein